MIARDQALEAFETDTFDVVVIGGGITGAGVALDAASRGYSVALVERDDYACGTSSRSSKLIHGGLRYLQQFDIGLVREALLERALNVKLAPHLVKPLPMIVPSFGGKRPDRKLGIGLNMYDAMAVETLRRRVGGRRGKGHELDVDLESWNPDRHRMIDGEEVAQLIPALAGREPTGGYLFYDCQTDDVRLVFTILGEAERFGAVCANRCGVESLLEENGKAVGVKLSGGGEVRAANVINATGVWADQIKPEELHDEADVPVIRPSRGTHITFSSEQLPLEAGAIVPAGEGRSIFALPWLGRTLIGTTDNNYEGSLEHVPPSEDDVHYLLEAVNEFFDTSLGPGDVTGAYAGVRPLIATGDPKKSVDISRRAELYETSSGLVTITGGKLTTWRKMAKMAVDRIVEREAREAPCRTHEIQLGMPVKDEELPVVGGVKEDTRAMLAGRYGHAAIDVLAVAREGPALAERISPDLPDLVAEAVFAARRQQARTVGDVL
ncbi:MAG: glycerol-3-phosphate dehydrogenase/oxidase, partial [Thermoleophilaceae bacterium]|nr:glycerol-3-phosphate dehydrogenase/oxidase [Thermoleophilaceae bacterium]